MPESALKQLLRRWRRATLSAAWRRFGSSRSFTVRGAEYFYFYHAYNETYRNERAVEIPIVWPLVARLAPERVLEVGNVLSHYFPTRHDVVDKFERAEGVQNLDVVDIDAARRYDLIVSISTLEHVGFDEQPKDPGKPARAIDHLRRCLSPAGRLVVTLPIGYNPQVDADLRAGRIPRDGAICLRRISRSNRWREVGWDDIQGARYRHPYHNANGLVILTLPAG